MSANLVNQSFFVRDINIPNTEKEPTKQRVVSFIEKYEPQCLLNLLGYPLFKVFGSEVSPRMTDLLGGAEYIDFNGNTRKWEGLVHDINQSLIAYYIYYHYIYHTVQSFNNNSMTINKVDGAVNVSPGDMMVTTWNSFSEGSHELLRYLWDSVDLGNNRKYPEFTSYQLQLALKFSRKINIFNI